VVNPLQVVYSVIPTLETRGHGCQFHHLTVFQNKWWLPTASRARHRAWLLWE